MIRTSASMIWGNSGAIVALLLRPEPHPEPV